MTVPWCRIRPPNPPSSPHARGQIPFCNQGESDPRLWLPRHAHGRKKITKTIRSSADNIFSPGCLRPHCSRPLRERRDHVCESSAFCPRLTHFGLTFRVACYRTFFPLLLPSLSHLSPSTGSSRQRPPISDQNRWRDEMVCVSTYRGDPTNRGRGCT